MYICEFRQIDKKSAISAVFIVGLPGIEPGSHAPEAYIIAFIPQPAVVDLRGIGPLASAMRMQCSTILSYKPHAKSRGAGN